MTGFGRAIIERSIGTLIIEMQSVNRKYLEVAVSLPKEWSRFEPEVRKWVTETGARGQVFVKMTLLPNEIGQGLPDAKTLKTLKEGWEKLAHQVGLSTATIDLPFLLQYLPNGGVGDDVLHDLKEVFQIASESWLEMKEKEGQALFQDLTHRLRKLERMMGEIEALTPDAVQKMKLKLFDKMKEALQGEGEERLLREVALFAEKVDVSEEITRFRSHIAQFQTLLKQVGSGRKMDFLIQEMGREINTIGSKSMEAKISHLVVEMKSELEKMREQVQNIE